MASPQNIPYAAFQKSIMVTKIQYGTMGNVSAFPVGFTSKECGQTM